MSFCAFKFIFIVAFRIMHRIMQFLDQSQLVRYIQINNKHCDMLSHANVLHQ